MARTVLDYSGRSRPHSPATGTFCAQITFAGMKPRDVSSHTESEEGTKMATTLTEGTKVPDFALPSTTGGTLGPSNYVGQKKLVIAFYPKDNTSG